jgi:DNA invertase Pin-like site-specific DNA recombinase
MLNTLDAKPRVVLVAKIYRFARSPSDLLRILEYLDQKDIGFVSVNDLGIDIPQWKAPAADSGCISQI